MMETKICTGRGSCNQELPADNFYKDQHLCKKCFNKRYRHKPSKNSIKSKKYRDKKKAQILSALYNVPDFSLERDPNKCLVQRFLLANSMVSGSALMLPSYVLKKSITNYLDLIYDKTKDINKLTLVEKNSLIYQQVVKDANILTNIPKNLKLEILNSDLAYVKTVPNLVEADLMCSIKNALPVFKILFMKMNQQNKEDNALICTYSRRSPSGETYRMLEILEKITEHATWHELSYTLDKIPMIRVGIRDYLVRTDYSGGKYYCISFNYRFNSSDNMCTFMIKWRI